jgi:F0F1-type ATP synthase membrane subunit b/b'
VNYDAIAVYSQVVSAIVFLIVLAWMWSRFAQPAVMAAQAAQNERIALAERHRDEAKAALDTLRSEIDGANRDADAIRKRAADQAVHERDAVLEQTRDAGKRALQSAAGELDRARATAREQLRSELLHKALDAAHAQASELVDAGINAKLVGAFVSSLRRGDAQDG